MADFLNIVIPFIVALGLLFLALWATATRRQDARLAQLEKQQAVDSRAFAAQARIHHRRIEDLDLRLQCMAREMVTNDALARTWPATAVDRVMPTPIRPPAP